MSSEWTKELKEQRCTTKQKTSFSRGVSRVLFPAEAATTSAVLSSSSWSVLLLLLWSFCVLRVCGSCSSTHWFVSPASRPAGWSVNTSCNHIAWLLSKIKSHVNVFHYYFYFLLILSFVFFCACCWLAGEAMGNVLAAVRCCAF